jgi:hypothetical protein
MSNPPNPKTGIEDMYTLMLWLTLGALSPEEEALNGKQFKSMSECRAVLLDRKAKNRELRGLCLTDQKTKPE